MTSRFQVGQRAQVRVAITEALLDRFAELSGDTNALHMSLEFARSAGFQRRVGHGVLSLAFVSRLIGMELPGEGALWRSLQVTWLVPVFPGDEVEIEAVVKSVSEAHATLVLTLVARNQANVVVLRGEAVVGYGGAARSAATPDARPATAAQVAPTAPAPSRAAPLTGPGRPARPVLVTGGSRGIGRAIALRLATLGHPIAIGYRSAHDEAQATLRAIQDAGGTGVALAADLETTAGAVQLVDDARAQLGSCLGLVHCASPELDRAPLAEVQAEQLQRYFTLYAIRALEMVQAMLPDLKREKWGRVVLLGTGATHGAPPPGMLAYVTGKAAVSGLAKALAVELGPLGTTVNVIAPGLTATDLTRHLTERARLAEAARTPLRRLHAPDDTAAACAFLVSDEAAFITGVELPLTGGLTML